MNDRKEELKQKLNRAWARGDKGVCDVTDEGPLDFYNAFLNKVADEVLDSTPAMASEKEVYVTSKETKIGIFNKTMYIKLSNFLYFYFKNMERLHEYASDIAEGLTKIYGVKFEYKIQKTSDEIVLKEGEMTICFYAKVNREEINK